MKEINKGLIDSLFTLPSFAFVGVVFGINGIKEGLGLSNTLLMSVVMFHGAAQFAALNLMTIGAGIVTLLITVLFMNTRYLICSAGLALYLKDVNMRKILLIASMVTTPTFAVAMNRFKKERGSWNYLLGLHLISYATWIVGTAIGIMVGIKVPLSLQIGMNFAFYSLLIGVLVIGCNHLDQLLNILICGVISVLTSYVSKNSINIVLAPIIAATIMVLGEKWIMGQSE